MRIVIVNDGTYGDLYPFFGLGRALAERGHKIVICTNDVFRVPIERLGFRFVSTGTAEESEAHTANPDMWNPRKGPKTAWKSLVVPRLRPLFDLVSREIDSSTVVVCGLITAAFTRAVQEKYGIPLITTVLSPSVFMSARRPTRNLPIPPWLPYPARAALLWGIDKAIDAVMGPDLNRFRRELGLPPVSRIRSRWGFSPQGSLALFPDWFGPPQSDWPAKVALTGFPLFDEGWHAADPTLEDFLSRGPAPVVFTAGTGMRHAHAFFEAARQILGRLRRRGVFLSKSVQQIPADLPSSILYRDYAPLNTLLPRSAALVHHGGIGTTAQALAVGVPQLIVPYAYDQFDNADRLQNLGCGDAVKSLADIDVAARTLNRLLGDVEVRNACTRYQVLMESGAVTMARAADVIEAAGRRS